MNTTRPVSVAHLVFGLIYLGAAALWAVGAATDADVPDLALLGPAILIGAGAIGLVAIVINARNARTANRTDATAPDYVDLPVTDEEQQ